MIALFNYHFMLGSPTQKLGPLLGQTGLCTEAQFAALVRLGAAADTMCGLSPLEFGVKDWASDLRESECSYDGHEIMRAKGLVLQRVLPTLAAERSSGGHRHPSAARWFHARSLA